MEYFIKENGEEKVFNLDIMNLQKNDVVCLRLKSELPLNVCKTLRDNIQSVFPNNKVFLLTNDVEIGIIRGDENES